MADTPKIGKLWKAPGTNVERVVFAVFPTATTTRVSFEDGTHYDFPLTPDQEQDVETAALVSARALALVRIDQVAAQKYASGTATPSGPVDTSDRSVTFVLGLVSMAQLAIGSGLAFSQRFYFTDGTEKDVDAQAMIGIGLAVAAHMQAVQAYSRYLIGRVTAAQTLDLLIAIDVNAGWPV